MSDNPLHEKRVIKTNTEEEEICSLVLFLFWRKPLRSCGCVHRSRSWWGQRCRSSPGRWRGRRGSLCRRSWRRRSSPSGRDGSPLPWCCRQIPGHHRILLPLPQCSADTRAHAAVIGLHFLQVGVSTNAQEESNCLDEKEMPPNRSRFASLMHTHTLLNTVYILKTFQIYQKHSEIISGKRFFLSILHLQDEQMQMVNWIDLYKNIIFCMEFFWYFGVFKLLCIF